VNRWVGSPDLQKGGGWDHIKQFVRTGSLGDGLMNAAGLLHAGRGYVRKKVGWYKI